MTSQQAQWRFVSLAWIGLIFYSSTSTAGHQSERAYQYIYETIFQAPPQSNGGVLHFIAEKSVHVTLFCVLGILLSLSFGGSSVQRFAKAVVGGLVIGTLSELLQGFFPDRDPAIRDVLINLTSASIGAAIAWTMTASAGRRSVLPIRE